MKKYIIGFLLSILPIYNFFSWLYIFNKYPKKDQPFKIKEFNKMFFDFSINQTTHTIINIIFSFVAIYFLIKFQTIKNVAIKIISGIVIMLLILIILYNFWGLL